MTETSAAPAPAVDIGDLFRTFGKIGLMSFGGPAAQIALMHRVLVAERGWLSEREYLTALSFCMVLPGPEAMQLATYAGWKLKGTAGGLIAGGLFVLPGAAVVLALSLAYALAGQVPLVQALFLGIQAAVVVIVAEALMKVARRALKRPLAWGIAAATFVAIFAFGVPYPAVVLAAAAAGWFGLRGAPVAAPVAAPVRAQAAESLRTALIWAALWLLPLALLWPAGGILFDIGAFFAKMAALSFGGAYALLAWMTQEVVALRGWLTTAEMIDGLGLAETTPGPLILVTQFVGFLAAFRDGGIPLGIAGAAVTLWSVFAPSFLFIFAGAPWMDRIAAAPRLSAALSGVTAAVVGVILSLALWFAAQVFFAEVGTLRLGPAALIAPAWASFDLRAGALAVAAAVMLLVLRLPLLAALALSAAGGVAIQAF